MWTFRASLEQLSLTDERFWRADPAALHAAVSELAEGWHPSLRRIMAEGDIPATFAVGFHASEPVKPWQTTNVTLLGDAIHSMPPFRGVGANTALRDAALLRRKLVDIAENRMTWFPAIREYEEEMRRYGFEAVKDSIDNPLFGIQSFRRLATPRGGSGAN
jgi:2-polyprenyl-6-methoxyphenol hydroxylase-like FAD-dependent oxidoreductase